MKSDDVTSGKPPADFFRLVVDAAPAILENALDAVVSMDHEGRIIGWNRQAESIFGWSRAEALGRCLADTIIPPLYREAHRDGLAHFLATGEGPALNRRFEINGWRRDGHEFRVELTITPVRTGTGITFTAFVRDITERIRAANDLRRAHEELELRIQARTVELANVNAALRSEIQERQRGEVDLRRLSIELVRSNGELEQFAYVASHDLQEPLRKVQAFGEMLAHAAGSALNDEARDYLRRMQGAAKRMSVLITDLLIYSRITTQAQPFVEVDLTRIAHDVVSDLEARVRESVARVDIGELPNLDADPTQMRQLLQNLISNALKYHRAGESPQIKVTARTVSIAGSRPGDNSAPSARLCEITVEDNGIGFDEKYLERIFLPFQRLHGRQEYDGTGMGLAICQKIVDRHGGTITAQSAPGKGARFVVMLPLRHAQEESPHGEIG